MNNRSYINKKESKVNSNNLNNNKRKFINEYQRLNPNINHVVNNDNSKHIENNINDYNLKNQNQVENSNDNFIYHHNNPSNESNQNFVNVNPINGLQGNSNFRYNPYNLGFNSKDNINYNNYQEQEEDNKNDNNNHSDVEENTFLPNNSSVYVKNNAISNSNNINKNNQKSVFDKFDIKKTNHQDNIKETTVLNNNNNNDSNNEIFIDEEAEKVDNIFQSREFSYLENNKILNTLRSQQSLNTEEIRNLPSMLLDLQQALNKSNKNVIDLREKLSDLIVKERNNKEFINELSKKNLKLQNKHNNLLSSLIKYEKKEQEYAKLAEKADEEVNSLIEKNAEYAKLCNEQENKIQELNNNLNLSIERNKQLNILLNKEKNEVSQLKNTYSEIDDNINDIQFFKETILQLKDETNDLLTKLKNSEENNNKLKNDMLGFETKLKNCLQIVKQEKKENQRLHQELITVKEGKADTERVKNETELLMLHDKKEKDKLVSAIEVLQKEKSELYESLKELNKNYNLIKTEIKEIKEKEMTNNSYCNNQKDFTSRFNNKINDNIQNNDSSQIQMNNNNKKENKIENQNNNLNKLEKLFKDNESLYFELQLSKYLIFTILDGLVETNQLESIAKEIGYNNTHFEELKLKCSTSNRNRVLTYSKLSLKIAELLKDAFTAYTQSKDFFNAKENKESSYSCNNNKLSNKNHLVLLEKEVFSLKNALNLIEKKNEALSNCYESVQNKLLSEINLRQIIHSRYLKVRGNLRVMCRIRPFLENEVNTSKVCKFYIENDSALEILNDNNKFNKKFEFDYVFGMNSTQQEVYSEVSLLTKNIVNGNNFCVMSYGQTCTGKTFTIQGNKNFPGIILFTVKEIFEIFGTITKVKDNTVNDENNSKENFNKENNSYYYDYNIGTTKTNKTQNVNKTNYSNIKTDYNNNNYSKSNQQFCSTINYTPTIPENMSQSSGTNTLEKDKCEINKSKSNSNLNKEFNYNINSNYNNYLISNLSNIQASNCKLSIAIVEVYNENIYNLLSEKQSQLNIFENSDGVLAIPDLNPVEIKDLEECEKIIKIASKLRQTSSTYFNDRSSRSHLIFSLFVKITDLEGNIIRSRINFVDLAGSERLSRNKEMIDETLKKELSFIHLSLNSIANVLNAIAVNQNHVPYRDSKLTHYLKDSLSDNFNIILLLHVSPHQTDIGETCSTLEFGTRIAKLSNYKIGRERGKSSKWNID